MPKLTKSMPKYRKHRASGQAVVSLGGTDHYLGPHGTKASRLEYDRVIHEWLANGRRPIESSKVDPTDKTVVELAAAFLHHAKQHYVKHGQPTSELSGMKTVLVLCHSLVLG